MLERFGPVWGWFAAGDLLFTNLVTLIAEFVAIRIGLAYFHVGSGVAAALGLVLVVSTLSGRPVLALGADRPRLGDFNGLFLLAAIMVKPHSGPSCSSLDFMPFPGGSFNTLLLLLASTVGATVTPWMIFFQQSASADKGMTARDISHGRYDTAAGAVLAAVFGVGALIAGAALLTHGGSGIQGFTGAGFPGALTHVAGTAAGPSSRWGSSRPERSPSSTICASTAYATGECVGVPTASTTSRATPPSFTPPTPGSRCSPRRSSSSPARRCCRSRSTPTCWRPCCCPSAWCS